MKLKKKTIIIILLATLCAGAALADECMRCAGRLACVGDNMAEVFLTCGTPDFQGAVSAEIQGERDVVVIGGKAYFSEASYTKRQVSRWIYYCGPNRFMRILTFEGDGLVKIETGGKR